MMEWDLSGSVDESPKTRLAMMVSAGQLCRGVEAGPQKIQDFVEALSKTAPELAVRLPAGQEQYAHTMHLLYTAWEWMRCGRPVFDLTHSLAAALMLTDPPKMAEGEELEVPFPAFAIRIPPNLIPVFGPKGQTWADTVWVHRFKSIRKVSGQVEDFVRWTTESGSVSVWRDRHPAQLYVDDERIYVLFPGEDIKPKAEDDITMDSSLRLIRNLCSWLVAGNQPKTAAAPTKPSKKARKRKKAHRKDRGPRPRIIRLGQGVKLGPELRRMATEVALGQSKGAKEGWRLRAKHVVVGHWKMQAYGEGRKLRKRIWVEPYWRGPEGDQAWAEVLSA